MKLYGFQPIGYGSASAFVMAESEEQAREYISAFINKHNKNADFLDKINMDGFDTDYYKVTEAGIGEILFNEND